MTADECVGIAAARHGITAGQMRGRGKRARHVSRARATAVRMALSLGITRADMARALGVDWSSVQHLARRRWE